ncbi:hypothetical protein MJG53_008886 [Ovis ammon polii x Ovis aries]|uniref:Uncharacterized protein n=1 Tax=Ovis ammon polii x Ovis aries TaxID=2918886 RepID=A0ACB9UXI6_9CETA|nr:hypothetical protein MJT46_008521 [Ovis ammon polii x Ovis aries]KAI4582335.1 hypothetical protein MJG53_008886 [Ovis ammon polii x Ovis aries]
MCLDTYPFFPLIPSLHLWQPDTRKHRSPELLQPTKSTFFSCDQLLGKAKSPQLLSSTSSLKTSKSAISSSFRELTANSSVEMDVRH